MKTKRPSFGDFKDQAFKNERLLQEYNRQQPEFDLASQLILARRKSKISQAELAIRLHTKQPSIARFENGGFSKSSISKLQEYANALGYGLHIELVPQSVEQHIKA